MGLRCLSFHKSDDSTTHLEERSKGPEGTQLPMDTLQLNSEVKYLGLFLDKGLTWKAQLTNVMKEAYRAFQTCKAHLVKPEF